MVESIFGTDENTQIYVAINLIATIVGCIASAICILLIYRMKKITGHIKLVLYLSYYQFIYDFFCFQNNADVDYYQRSFAIFIHLITGLTSSFISNWIAFAAFYIVIYRKNFDVLKHFNLIHLSALIPGLINGIVYYSAALPENSRNDEIVNDSILDGYNNLRVASIIINFFFVISILYKIRQMNAGVPKKTQEQLAIQTLANRIILYPIAQAIGRSGYAWYEYTYGSELSVTDATSEQYSCLLFLSIITPTVSVGYLIIFLLMQPKAYDHFKAMLCFRTHHEELRDNSLFQEKEKAATDEDTTDRKTTLSTLPGGSSDLSKSGSKPLNPGSATSSDIESSSRHDSMISSGSGMNLNLTQDDSFFQQTDDELFDILNRASMGMNFVHPTYSSNRNSLYRNEEVSFTSQSRPNSSFYSMDEEAENALHANTESNRISKNISSVELTQISSS